MVNNIKTIENLISAAFDLKNSGHEQQAIDLLNDVITIDPNYSYAYFFQGMFYHDIGDLERAEESYKKAQKLNPKNILINKIFGAFLLSQERLDEGVYYLKIAFYEDPTDVEVAKWIRLFSRIIPDIKRITGRAATPLSLRLLLGKQNIIKGSN